MSDELIAAIEAPRATRALVGHEGAAQALLDAWRSGRVPHGWLFAGPKGVGKATLAWRLVRFVMAGGTGDDLDGEGAAARRVAAGSHPDVRLVRRTYNPKPPHRFRTEVAVDDARALGPFLRQTAAGGGWRAVVVDAADEMNPNAANALLKLLEEPPPKTLLLLVAHAPGRLLPTIRSRCRRLDLRPLAETQVAQVLALHRPALDVAEATALARLAEGAPGRGISLADAGGLALYREMIALLESLPELDAVALHAAGDRFARANGEGAFRTFTGLLGWWLEGLVRDVAAGTPTPDVVPSEAALKARLTAAGDLDRWLEVWDNTRRLTARGDAVNLDRKQVLLGTFFALAAAASGSPSVQRAS